MYRSMQNIHDGGEYVLKIHILVYIFLLVIIQ